MQYYIVNLIIVLNLIWVPLQMFILNIDGAGRIPFLAIVLGLSMTSSYKLLTTKPFLFYFFWIIFVFVNSSVKGFQYFDNSYFILFNSIFTPFAIMILTFYSASFNQNNTINTIIIGLYIYLIFGIFYNYLGISWDLSERLIGDLNANGIGIRATFIIFFVLLQYLSRRYNLMKTIILILFPSLMVVLSGSRSAFIALVIILVFFIIGLSFYRTPKYKITSIIMLIILLFIGNFILENFSIGERLATTQKYIIGTERETGTLLDYMGDRGYQYYEAWPIFINNYITGIGLNNYPLYSRYSFVFHSEYMIQFCECGIIGFMLFILFYSGIFKSIQKVKYRNHIGKSIFIMTVGGFVSLIFLGAVTRICYYSFYFCFLGVVYSMTRINSSEIATY